MSSTKHSKLQSDSAHMAQAVGRTLARLRTEPGTAVNDMAILDLEWVLAYHGRAAPVMVPALTARHTSRAN